QRQGKYARALEVVSESRVGRLRRTRIPELSDEEARMSTLRVIHVLEDRAELPSRVLFVASDLELDERGMPVLRDLTCVARIERRLDVLNGSHLRNARDDILDRGVEGRGTRSNGSALDQDAL